MENYIVVNGVVMRDTRENREDAHEIIKENV
jgi:hypothetical protein